MSWDDKEHEGALAVKVEGGSGVWASDKNRELRVGKVGMYVASLVC